MLDRTLTEDVCDANENFHSAGQMDDFNVSTGAGVGAMKNEETQRDYRFSVGQLPAWAKRQVRHQYRLIMFSCSKCL